MAVKSIVKGIFSLLGSCSLVWAGVSAEKTRKSIVFCKSNSQAQKIRSAPVATVCSKESDCQGLPSYLTSDVEESGWTPEQEAKHVEYVKLHNASLEDLRQGRLEAAYLWINLTGDIRSALIEAASYGQAHIVQSLLKQLKDVCIDGADLAFREACQQRHPSVVAVILDFFKGRSEALRKILNFRDPHTYETPLIALLLGPAQDQRVFQTLEILLKNSLLDINASNIAGMTALKAAILQKNNMAAEMLLQRPDLEVNALNRRILKLGKRRYCYNEGETPLSMAVRTGNFEIMAMLLNDLRTDVSVQNGDGTTALSCACTLKDLQSIRMILNHLGKKVRESGTFLQSVLFEEKKQSIEWFLNKENIYPDLVNIDLLIHMNF